jgi:hypothetical protein
MDGEMGKGKQRADGVSAGRKPWDPPFPRRETPRQEQQGMGRGSGSVWVMPPTPPKKSGREMEASGVARRLFPPDLDGDEAYSYEYEGQQEELEPPDRGTTPKPTPTPAQQVSAPQSTSKPAPAKKKPKAKSIVMSAVWFCVAILAVLLSILAFAILIAHCLAEFLIHKTEGRLGEARRSIMQGGEMRLCLCAA